MMIGNWGDKRSQKEIQDQAFTHSKQKLENKLRSIRMLIVESKCSGRQKNKLMRMIKEFTL